MAIKYTYSTKEILNIINKNSIVIVLVLINVFLLYKINTSEVSYNSIKHNTDINIDYIPNVKEYFITKYSLIIFISDKNCGMCNNMVINHIKTFHGSVCIFIDGNKDFTNTIKKQIPNNTLFFENTKKTFPETTSNPKMLLVHCSGKVLLQEPGDITAPEKTSRFFEKANIIAN